MQDSNIENLHQHLYMKWMQIHADVELAAVLKTSFIQSNSCPFHIYLAPYQFSLPVD